MDNLKAFMMGIFVGVVIAIFLLLAGINEQLQAIEQLLQGIGG